MLWDLCTSKTHNSSRFCKEISKKPFYADKVQFSVHCHQQSRSWVHFFLKVRFIHMFCTSTKYVCWHLGEKISSVVAAYVRYNSNLTRQLSTRVLWLWGIHQCQWNITLWNIIYQDMDTVKVRLETLGSFERPPTSIRKFGAHPFSLVQDHINLKITVQMLHLALVTNVVT